METLISFGTRVRREFWAVAIVALSATAVHSDEVTVVDSQGKVLRRTGTITDVKGGNLTIRLVSGREANIPIERVNSIDATWSKAHQAADMEFDSRKFLVAVDLYRKAFNEEKRGWVKRRLLGRVIWCYRNTGRHADACRMFDRLIREDTSTSYFESIPLLWQRKQCPSDVKAIVGGWLGRESTPARRLMAASWLLVQDGKRSTATLRELGKDPSKQISRLAIAQLWRAELLTLKESRLSWWNEQLALTSLDLRVGPYFLLGQSYEKFGRVDDAALAYLRVPTLYPDDIVLGRICLSRAAGLLLNDGQTQEAINLFQQVAALDPDSAEGQQANNKLRELIH